MPGIAARFAAQAARDPDGIAVTCEGVQLSYVELDRRANRVANLLLALGVGEGTLVGLCMDRSLELIVAMLGIVKAGAAYLPLDLVYPRERLAFMLEDAQAPVVLTLARNRDAIPGDVACVVCVDDDPRLAAMSEAASIIDHGPDALAYVIYTSGSTGQPKGCQVTQGNVVRLFSATDAWFHFDHRDVWTFFHSHAFDFSVWEIWGALLHGGRVVVVPLALSRLPAEFHQLLVDERVTVLNQTPSAFLQLMRADEVAGNDARLALRLVIFGGEALELQALAPWFDRHGDQLPRLVNMYGITETTVHVTYRPITHADLERGVGSVIGQPIPDLVLHVLDASLVPVPVGSEGELFVGGGGVSRGYLNRPELNAQRFIQWRGADGASAPQRLYRTGDLVRQLPDGDLEYLGRIDKQVKIRGFRIETGEIEAVLNRHSSVRACAVIAREDHGGGKRLIAYVVAARDAPDPVVLRRHLSASLPDYMVPAAFVAIDVLPLTENGKLDIQALPAPDRKRPRLANEHELAADASEQAICDAFGDLLGIDGVGRGDNFFELGGDSLLATRLVESLSQAHGIALPATLLFRHPTPAALARVLGGERAKPASTRMARAYRDTGNRADARGEPIAIIAMAGRFPGAADVEAFWDNLCAGRDSIRMFGADELDPTVTAAERGNPAYVPARGVIDDVEWFDAGFFGIGARQAELMDPQQRIFLELCWECLERGGHVPDAGAGPIGVFAGMYNASYFQRHVASRPDLIDKLGAFNVMLDNEKDFIATRVAHKLNLTGPAISVHTACSTSLVAICQAVDSLRSGQCDMALAGGIAITCPPRSGYLHQEGAMLSPDGHTRTFDVDARGTVFSDGAAVLLLKRWSDAQADGDPVIALIRGGAVNNDGADKASFTAPSVDGQAAVIAMAHRDAGIDARCIGYVEAHGTATPLGDPIELQGLCKAFRHDTEDTGFCRIGSVKSNVGHLVIAAGAAGLIKTALSLQHERIPASLHFKAPNPALALGQSPFVVNASLSEWPRVDAPRRAGVSSFGVGGTNAHVVLEEAPLQTPSEAAEGPQLLVLSARTPAALGHAARNLASHLESENASNLADVAWTLARGRKQFSHRLAMVADGSAAAAAMLCSEETLAIAARSRPALARDLVWLFPGQGATYPGMGRGLHADEPLFRAALDRCVLLLRDELGFDLRERMFSDDPDALLPTAIMQPATFAFEYALAQLWLGLGLRPAAMVGHSVGEFVAATLAGVFELADALRLVARRGALMQAQPPGAMLSLRISRDALTDKLPPDVSLAAENAAEACVVAGAEADIATFQSRMEAEGIACRRLRTSHAFHSPMMEPVLAPFRRELATMTLHAPQLPIVSTATGEWLDAATATSTDYWTTHLRHPVRFAPALARALELPAPTLLEVGPRASLCALARQQPRASAQKIEAVASVADQPGQETATLRMAAGRLWSLGVSLDPAAFDRRSRRRRVRLPTYPFERERYWVEAMPAASQATPISNLIAIANPEPVVPAAPAIATAAPMQIEPRMHRLLPRLREVFEDVAGFDLAEADPTANFIALGMDSLMLTQVALQLQKAFAVPLGFRELMGEGASLQRLAELLDARMPPDALPAVPSMPTTAPDVAVAAVPAMTGTIDGDYVRQVIAQQMHLMGQQLALLGGAPVTSHAPAQVAQAPVPAVTAADTVDDEAAVAHTRYDVRKAFGAIARIDNRGGIVLDDRQHERLDGFIARYSARTAKSKAYNQAQRPHMADPRVVNGFRPLLKEIVYQIVVERSKGAHLWDLDGNRYVDATNGFGMSLFGWQPPFVLDAVRRQLELGYEIGPQHPLAGEVAKLVCELTGHDRAALCNTGSEAVLGALRIARTVTGRETVVLFSGSYHGIIDEMIVRGTRKLRAVPAAPGILRNTSEHVIVLDYGTPESLQIIRERVHEIAAILVEPVQSRRPDFQPVEFLRDLRQLATDSGALLVFDEVVTGFRAHPAGIQGLFGIRADLATYGKVVGGGYPIGVIAGRRDCMDALDGGAWQFGDDSVPTVGVTYFAGTFVRHPLALAAAKASLEHMREHGPALQQRLSARVGAFADEINAFCAEHGAPVAVRQFASVWKTQFLEEHPLQDLLFAMMRSRGVHILDNFPCFFTTAHEEADFQAIADAFKDSLLELQESGFLPRNTATTHTVMDAAQPLVAGARLGRDPDGKPAWFVPDPQRAGKYLKVG